jgi:hypothetical protein
MAKHEQGTVRVIPADPTHFFHQVNRYHPRDVWPANLQKPRRNNDMARELIYPVETIHAPGRHRVDETVPDNTACIYVTAQVNFNGPAFECVRRHDGDMAIEFEYLPIPCCPPGFSCPDCA